MLLCPRQRVLRGGAFTLGPVRVEVIPGPAGSAVRVHCPVGPLSWVVLRWTTPLPVKTLWLADHWERSYGDLQWRGLQPERVMPWYFAAHLPADGSTLLAGVRTQPSTFCFWMADSAGISLWLDFRNGGNPSWPGDREILAATILSDAGALPGFVGIGAAISRGEAVVVEKPAVEPPQCSGQAC